MLKRIFFVLSALIISNCFQAQVTERKLGSFRKLIVGDKIIVQLVKSEQESAQIKVQGIDASSVKTDLAGQVLNISIVGEPFTRKKVMVTLNYVKINSIVVNNGAEVSTSSLFKADTLFVELKSGGMLYLDADIAYLKSRIAEGALLNARGYATIQDVSVSTTGTLSAFDLESDKITVKTSTGGKAKINVENELDAEANSKGYISYKGKPAKINRITNSGGSIVVYEP